jgi:uncharacterized protein YabN with tetrapyrrole methylase and pyrophosphatase domain
MDLLDRISRLEQDAERFGFCWDHSEQIMAQIQSECAEVNEHLISMSSLQNSLKLQEEIGDLLHAVFSLCIFCQLSPKDTLTHALDKFEHRLQTVKQLANIENLIDLTNQSFETRMAFWNRAKKLLNN